MKKVCVETQEVVLGFEDACDLAACEAARAKGTRVDSMKILAWYDRRSRRSFPEVGFTEGNVVNWEKSAASSGADVWVEIEGGNYIFLCGSSLKH